MSESSPLIINGWSIFMHPLFLSQFEELTNQVQTLKQKDSGNYKKKNASKRLAAIIKLAFEVIPNDPALVEYRLGLSLGHEHKHWFRARFFQQYRLFFRFHLQTKVMIYTWVNDQHTKRAYASKTDAYRVFSKMLNSGHPPGSWDKLLQEAKNETKYLETFIPPN